MVRVSVLYPNYINKHMKLVRDRLGAFGVARTEVDRGVAGGAPGSSAPYVAIGHVYVSSLAEFQKGMGQHGKEILGDIPNYTNIQPQMQISEIAG